MQVCCVISISSFKSQKQIHWTYSCCYKLANLVLPLTAERWSENICKLARTLKPLSSAERCCCCCCSPKIFSNQLLGCVNFVALGQVLFFGQPESQSLTPSISGWALFNAVYSIAPPGCPFSCLLCLQNNSWNLKHSYYCFAPGIFVFSLCLKRIAFSLIPINNPLRIQVGAT